MNEPGFFLVVRFRVAPQAETQLLGWLDGGHVAEVVGQPGFLWCKRIRLERRRRREGTRRSTASPRRRTTTPTKQQPLIEKFSQERAPFEKHMKHRPLRRPSRLDGLRWVSDTDLRGLKENCVTSSGIRIMASCPVCSSWKRQVGALRYFAANWSKEPVAGEEQ